MPETINITSKTAKPFNLISNFAPTPFEMDGRTYSSVESFWQGLKFDDQASRDAVAASNAYDAKRRGAEQGYGATIKYDGTEFPPGTKMHWDLMERACLCKFKQNAEARAALLATYDWTLEHKMPRDSTVIPGAVMAAIWMRVRDRLDPEPPEATDEELMAHAQKACAEALDADEAKASADLAEELRFWEETGEASLAKTIETLENAKVEEQKPPEKTAAEKTDNHETAEEASAAALVDKFGVKFGWTGAIVARDTYSDRFLSRPLTDEEWAKVKATTTWKNSDTIFSGIAMMTYRLSLVEAGLLQDACKSGS